MTSKRELTPDNLGHIGGSALITLSQGTTATPETLESVEKKLTTVNYVWSSSSLAYEVMTQPGASGAGSTTVDANLTSAGSTRLVGQFTVANPTTSVSLSAGSSANMIGAVAQGAGSTSIAPWYVISTASAGAGSTTVDASLTSAGSTKLVGIVELSAGSSSNMLGAVAQGAGSTSIAPWYVISTAAAGAGSTTVDANLTSAGSTRVIGTVGVSSGVILGAGSSANTIGSVALVAGTSANTIGSVANVAGSSATLIGAVAVSSGVVLGAGSSANTLGSVTLAAGTSANTLGSVTLAAGTSANTIGSVALIAGSSANVIGQVAQGPSSTANYWFMMDMPFSSGGTSRTSISTTIDIQIVAANANRKAMVVANRSTVQTVGLGFSTAILTTALANVDLFLGPSDQLIFGANGTLPLYTGPMRGLNLTSTTVAGSVSVIQFTT